RRRMPARADAEQQLGGGRWFRRGRTIVLMTPDEGNGVSREVAVATPSARELIDPRMDVFAQDALPRMRRADPISRAGASEMISTVKAGGLAGIYKEDERVPATRAQRMGLGWWQLIPAGEDAALVLDPADLMTGA